MHTQQSNALKWILVVLLVAICLICFILCMVKTGTTTTSGGNAATTTVAKSDSEQNKKNEPSSTLNPQPSDEAKITYSQFPRNAIDYGDYKIGHIGGTNADVFKNAFYFCGNYYVVIDTKSNDYDFDKSGIAVAIVKENSLIQTAVFASGETYVKSDFINGFITIVTKSEKLNVYSVSPTLSLVSKQKFDLDNVAFVESYGKTMAFGFKNNALYAFNYSAVKSVFASQTETTSYGEVLSAFKADGGYAILAKTDGVCLYRYNGEFSLIDSLSGDYLDATLSTDYLAVVTSAANATLSVYGHDFSLIGVSTIDNFKSARFCPSNGGFVLVTDKGYYNLCKHFDVLKFKRFEGEYISVTVATSNDSGLVLAQTDTSFDLIEFENYGNYKIKNSFTSKPLEKRLFATNRGCLAFFTVATMDGIFKDNFGDYETFWICYSK